MTHIASETARNLVERMNHDMEQFQREQEARQKADPIIRQMHDAYYRSPPSHRPTDLHVSPQIHAELREVLDARADSLASLGQIRFMNCPVTEIADLDGFRWVRKQPNSWQCGPVAKAEGLKP